MKSHRLWCLALPFFMISACHPHNQASRTEQKLTTSELPPLGTAKDLQIWSEATCNTSFSEIKADILKQTSDGVAHACREQNRALQATHRPSCEGEMCVSEAYFYNAPRGDIKVEIVASQSTIGDLRVGVNVVWTPNKTPGPHASLVCIHPATMPIVRSVAERLATEESNWKIKASQCPQAPLLTTKK